MEGSQRQHDIYAEKAYKSKIYNKNGTSEENIFTVLNFGVKFGTKIMILQNREDACMHTGIQSPVIVIHHIFAYCRCMNVKFKSSNSSKVFVIQNLTICYWKA